MLEPQTPKRKEATMKGERKVFETERAKFSPLYVPGLKKTVGGELEFKTRKGT